jgi:hypothetical protein
MATVGCIRVSTDRQNYNGQKLSILNYVNDNFKGTVDDWIEGKSWKKYKYLSKHVMPHAMPQHMQRITGKPPDSRKAANHAKRDKTQG